jgi:hypothetical protein
MPLQQWEMSLNAEQPSHARRWVPSYVGQPVLLNLCVWKSKRSKMRDSGRASRHSRYCTSTRIYVLLLVSLQIGKTRGFRMWYIILRLTGVPGNPVKETLWWKQIMIKWHFRFSRRRLWSLGLQSAFSGMAPYSHEGGRSDGGSLHLWNVGLLLRH